RSQLFVSRTKRAGCDKRCQRLALVVARHVFRTSSPFGCNHHPFFRCKILAQFGHGDSSTKRTSVFESRTVTEGRIPASRTKSSARVHYIRLGITAALPAEISLV